MAENPFKRTFTLVQHTPLIHFQYDQPGATLRATEVKPKLDKFLWERISKEEKQKWRISEEQEALGYKLRFNLLDAANQRDPLSTKVWDADKNRWRPEFPMFLADMDQNDPPKHAVMGQEIEVCVQSFFTDLLKKLDNLIVEFFASHTFGMRSTKGYGSFTVKGQSAQSKPAFSFTVPAKEWKVAMRYIDLFYKSVRSGINGAMDPVSGRFVPGFYMKPMLFVYANAGDDGVKWEKRIIKQLAGDDFYYRGGGKRHTKGQPRQGKKEDWPKWQEKEKEAIVRDVLGLSSVQQWVGYTKEKVEKISVAGQVERFASPWLFKPIKLNDDQFRIDVFIAPFPKEYLGSLFYTEVGGTKLKKPKAEKALALPIWKDFNMNTFIKDYLKKKVLETAISHENSRDQSRIQKILVDIYTKIQKNA